MTNTVADANLLQAIRSQPSDELAMQAIATFRFRHLQEMSELVSLLNKRRNEAEDARLAQTRAINDIKAVLQRTP